MLKLLKKGTKYSMKKTLLKHGLLVGVAMLSVLAFVPLTAKAEKMESTTTTNQGSGSNRLTTEHSSEVEQEPEDQLEANHQGSGSGSTQTQAKIEDQRKEEKAKAEAKLREAKTHLQDAKLRLCKARQTSITNAMKRISDRGQKQINLFSGIAERTEAFYVKKGKTLANYDALVADVATKKSAAQDAIAMIAAHGTSFDCSSADPKGSAASFREHQKLAIAALKEYKTSVKNLIVGVKSVQGTTSSESEQK